MTLSKKPAAQLQNLPWALFSLIRPGQDCKPLLAMHDTASVSGGAGTPHFFGANDASTDVPSGG